MAEEEPSNRFAKRSSFVIYEVLHSPRPNQDEKREAFSALIGREENGRPVLDAETLDLIEQISHLNFLRDLVQEARAMLKPT